MKEHFSSTEEYLEHQRRRDAIEEEYGRLVEADIAQMRENPKLTDGHLEERRALSRQRDAMLEEYTDRLSIWLHSRCPFCNELLYCKIDPFSLDGDWWHWPFVPREEKIPACSHLFCIDGALNLDGHQPAEVRRGKVSMASEVPFVKPRLLELGNVIAVIHRLPKIAGKYVGYPIVYFGNPRPPLAEGSLGWARTEYHDEDGRWDIVYDVQDYDLDKWIMAGKVCWIDPSAPEHSLVCRSPEIYPYRSVKGRREPYTIQDGQVWSGYPVDGSRGGP